MLGFAKLVIDCVNCVTITNNTAGTLSLPVTRNSTKSTKYADEKMNATARK